MSCLLSQARQPGIRSCSFSTVSSNSHSRSCNVPQQFCNASVRASVGTCVERTTGQAVCSVTCDSARGSCVGQRIGSLVQRPDVRRVASRQRQEARHGDAGADGGADPDARQHDQRAHAAAFQRLPGEHGGRRRCAARRTPCVSCIVTLASSAPESCLASIPAPTELDWRQGANQLQRTGGMLRSVSTLGGVCHLSDARDARCAHPSPDVRPGPSAGHDISPGL